MARCAREAMLAAVEIYNKPQVKYREQTVAFLLVNAWEVLIKARIVQQSGDKLQSIYRRKRNSRRFEYGPDKELLTIEIRGALSRCDLPEEAKTNIKGLMKIRNQATHLGVLVPGLKQTILEFSTASVQNFIKTYANWFKDSIEPPYLLPLGFVGSAQTTVASYPMRQKQLLKELVDLAYSQDPDDSGYEVVMQVRVELNRGLSGGGSIGLTTDPSAPKVSITDDEALKTFSTPYTQLVEKCRDHYPDFKQNQQFHAAMKNINTDPSCTYERRLDPTADNSSKKRFYNLERTLAKLDDAYATVEQSQRVQPGRRTGAFAASLPVAPHDIRPLTDPATTL